MSGDLISRGELEKALSELGRMYIEGIVDDKAYLPEQRVYEVLRSIPAVEAEPVVHAHWIRSGQIIYGGSRCFNDYCSRCGARGYDDMKRCPECGAHMDEEV